LKNLVPEIRTNMHLIAKEEVEAERLDRQIREQESRLDKDRTDLLKLKTDLSSGRETFQYAGRRYTVDQVKCDLSNRFERYKSNDQIPLDTPSRENIVDEVAEYFGAGAAQIAATESAKD